MGAQNTRLKSRVISDLVENTEFTKDEIKVWYLAFQKYYPEGYILIDDFKEIYSYYYPKGDGDSFAEHAFRIFDINNDDKIDFSEFVTGINISRRGTFEEKLTWLFELYDFNSDGFISKMEMMVIVKSIMAMTIDLSKAPVDENLAEKRVEEIFVQMNKQGDGLLTLKEFIEFGKVDLNLTKALGH